MGLLRRFKKKHKPEKDVDEKLPKELLDKRNFSYLNALISSNVKEITLDSDIILEDGEELIYPNGINVNVDLLVIDGNGHSIDARGKTSIFSIHEGKITFTNTFFKNSYSTGNALLIASQKSIITFKDCSFQDNQGRLVYNEGLLSFENIRFFNNISHQNELIFNNREIRFVNSGFKENESCLILNKGKMACSGIDVKGNHDNGKNLIVNEDGLQFIESIFADNKTISELCHNKGDLHFENCSFISNDGRLINNEHNVHLKSIMFEKNFSPQNGLIFNNGGMLLDYGEFRYNEAFLIFNNNQMKCVDVNVNNNKFDGKSLIVNENDLEFAKSKFENNEVKNTIYLNKGNSGFFNLLFENNVTNYLINNDEGKSLKIVENTFKNEEICESYYDILNNGFLTLVNSKFLIKHGKYILNNGEAELRGMPSDFLEGVSYDRFIEAYKPITKTEEKLPSELWGKRNFKYLDAVIKLGEYEIVLDRDILLEDGEELIYHKGIEISADNLVIDGSGYSIDAGNKTPIFNIREGMITFRNIHFKNAFSKDSALLLASEKSRIIVENCSFEDNLGRIIFNEGLLSLKYNEFVNNVSPQNELIFNNREIEMDSNSFQDNESQIIFNNNKDAEFSISESIFQNNRVEIAPIINIGNGNIKSCFFKDNVNYEDVYIDVYNKSKLDLDSTRFRDGVKTIFNDGDITLKDVMGEICDLPRNLVKLKPLYEFIESTENDDEDLLMDINVFDFDEKYVDELKSFKRSSDAKNFTYLDNLIHNSKQIDLTSDVCLDDEEQSIYQNGIKLDIDNSVINGNDCIINAKSIECLFNVDGVNITLKNIHFKFSFLKEMSSLISVNDGASLTLINCYFEHNSLDRGHAIFNRGNINIENCVFSDNRSNNEGSAIYSKQGKINVYSSEFRNNKSGDSGGAILNWGDLEIIRSEFLYNISKGYGGAIGNVTDANLKIKETTFIDNKSIGEGCGIYNENNLDVEGSCFSNHSSESNVIFSEHTLKAFNCIFKNNASKSIIKNDENAILDISSSKFLFNKVKKSTICNIGKSCGLEKVTFEENESEMEHCNNIYNKTFSRLTDVKLINSSEKSILNEGSMEIRKCSDEIINNSIHDLGEILIMDGKCENPFNFSALDNLIQKNGEKTIYLENDYILENCESYFYEGGIELSQNNLIIDGNGHTIDAKGKTRIFIVSGKNITLRNIKFKNGKLFEMLEEHITGGGALKTVNNSSLKLINCEFVDSESEDGGGAIFNNGVINSIDSIFDNNNSKHYGGAIDNRNILYLKNNLFKGNESRIAGAIFNFKTLHVENICLKENISNFPQDIFNNGFIEITDDGLDDELIFNVGEINKQKANINESFSFLASQIKEHTEICLKQDIVFDFQKDNDFINGIEIDKQENLIIDGKGFAIDANNRSRFFNLKNNASNIVFKNIIFKNASAYEFFAFDNNASISFINCKFIDNHTNLFKNDGSVKIENCQFIHNYSKGSVILNNNLMEVNGCEFIINTVSSKDGVINNNYELSIKNSRFSHNMSRNGGAINNQKNGILNIFDSLFDNNSSKGRGGALINFGGIKIEGSEFKSNFSGGLGGAIYNEENSQIKVNRIIFKDNFSSSSGGAVANWGNLILLNSIFEENSTNKDGGAIYVEDGELIIQNCSFLNNGAKDGAGIFNWGNLNIKDSFFKNNSAKKSGGALNIYGSESECTNTIFSNNISKLDGGAIYFQKGKLKLENNKFDSNNADGNGGAIINWSEMDIINTEFINNASKKNGGAINNQKTGRISISQTNIIGNNGEDGGGIYTIIDNTIKLENCNLNNNYPNDFK